jgi:hypothetical protein
MLKDVAKLYCKKYVSSTMITTKSFSFAFGYSTIPAKLYRPGVVDEFTARVCDEYQPSCQL